MRTIKIEITLTERESMLLDWAATPLSPDHVRLLVLREAARVVRNDIAFTLVNAQARADSSEAKAAKLKRVYHAASRSIEHDANGAEP